MILIKNWRSFPAIMAFLFLSGCASVPPDSIIKPFGPTLPKGTIPLKVGLCKLTDNRPDNEKDSLRLIEPIDEKVTAVLYQEFASCNLFQSITTSFYPKAVDIIIEGEITSYNWDNSSYAALYIPPIFPVFSGIWLLLGGTTEEFEGSAAINLTVVNAKTGEQLYHYDKKASQNTSSNLYTRSNYSLPGQETRESFRMVFEQFKEALLKDGPEIVQKVKTH